MTDVVTLGIRLVIDGKEVSGEIRGQAAAIQQLGQAAATSNKQAKTEADNYVASLKRQADALGMTKTQTMAYEASQHQLTSAQRESVAQSIKAIETHDRHQAMLGRVRLAAAAAGTAIVAGLVAALKSSVTAAIESEQAELRLQAVLRATGGVAGLTARELGEMAGSMQDRLGINDEAVKGSMAVLLTFRSVSRQSFGEAMEVAANLSRLMGTDLQSATLQLGKALEEPEQGLTALRRAGVSFSEEQKLVIKELVETGNQAEAITRILQIMKEQGLDKVAESMNQGLYRATNQLKNEWDDFLEALGRTPAVGGLVELTLGGTAARLREIKDILDQGTIAERVSYAALSAASFVPGAQFMAGRIGATAAARGRSAASAQDVQNQVDLDADVAARHALTNARDAYESFVRGFMTDNEKLSDQLRKLDALYRAGAMSLEEYTRAQARVRASVTKKGGKAPFDYVGAVIGQGLEQDLGKTFDRLRKEEAEHARSAAAAIDAETAAQERSAAVLAGFNQAQSTALQQLDFETKLLGLNEVEREKAIALRKLEADWIAASTKLRGEELDTAQRIYEQTKAELPGRIDALNAGKAAKTAQEEAGRESKRFWEGVSNDINRSLTDSIMRGFDKGEDFARNFGESLKRYFQTLSISVPVRVIANYATGLLASAFPGLPAMAAGGNGSGNGFSPANLSSLGNLFGANPFSGLTNMAGNTLAGAGFLGGSPMFGAIGGAEMAGLAALEGGGIASAGMTGASFLGPLGLGIGALALGSKLFGGSGKTPAVGAGVSVTGTVGRSGWTDASWLGHATAGDRATSWSTFAHGPNLNPLITDAFRQVEGYGRMLGLDTSVLNNARVPFSFRTGQSAPRGPTGADVMKAFEENIGKVTETLARKLLPNFDALARAGESAAQTLERLAQEARQAALNRMGAAIGLEDSTRDLWLTDLSPLTARERLDRASSMLGEYAAGARGGDIASFGKYSSGLRGYLQEASRFYGTSTADYRGIFDARQAESADIVGTTLNENAISLVSMGGSLEQIVGNTRDLDKRIEAAFRRALESERGASAAVQRAAARDIVQAVSAAGANSGGPAWIDDAPPPFTGRRANAD